MPHSIPFACDMTALQPDERTPHLATIQRLFGSVQTVQESADGYVFQLPAEDDMIATAAAFVAKERRCCPFFRFGIEVEPEGHVQLRLDGPEGVKPFILAEIGHALPAEVAGTVF